MEPDQPVRNGHFGDLGNGLNDTKTDHGNNSIDVGNVPEPTNGSLFKGKGKTPSDRLVLIPSATPILQVDLWKAASAAEINSKYARRFLQALIAEKLVEVVLIPRERARSALGYIQSSAKISSEDMPSS